MLTAGLDPNIDPGRAGIDRIFNQLLDDRGRPLDNLAGGNATPAGRIAIRPDSIPASGRGMPSLPGVKLFQRFAG